MASRSGPDWFLELFAANDAALLAAHGEHQVAALAARGAALEYTDAVTYLRTQAEALHQQ